jgi:two-component system sensor histidine kinase KdpD
MIQPRLDWCDLGDLLHAVSKGLDQELSDHPLSVNIPDDMPLVMLDFGLMEQAIINLVHNAAIHTPAGTSIHVDSRIQEGDCIIVVSDTGPGIPKNDLSRIFDKFYRPRGTTSGGTGLGLPIAKGFVEAHKGTLTVANRSSGGAEFVIRIPLGVSTKQ